MKKWGPGTAALAAAMLSVPGAFGAAEAPVVDYGSLLNTRFYEQGGMLFEHYDLVFAPPAPVDAQVEVLDERGRPIGKFAFFPDYHTTDKAFGRLRARGPEAGGPPRLDLPGEGRYVVQVTVNGQLASRFAFAASRIGGADAFDPQQRYRYDGPWRLLGYLSPRESRVMDFVYWTGGLDLPADRKRDQTRSVVLRDGKIIGHSNASQGHIADGVFVQGEHTLLVPHEPRRAHEARPLMEDDFKIDGRYEIRLERQSDGALLRRFPFTVKRGEIVPLSRATPKHQPRAYRKGGHYAFREAIWLEAAR